MADRKIEEAVRRAQGLSSVGGIGGRRRRISDDNPLMQGNLDPVDEPEVVLGDASPDEQKAQDRASGPDGGTGAQDVSPRVSRPVSAPVGGRSSRPVMRPQGARDAVSQSLSGGRSAGIVSDLGKLEARRAAKRNRARGVSGAPSGDSQASGSPSGMSDSKAEKAHDEIVRPVSGDSPSSDGTAAPGSAGTPSGDVSGQVTVDKASEPSAGVSEVAESQAAPSAGEDSPSDANVGEDAGSVGAEDVPERRTVRPGRGASRARASSGRKEPKVAKELSSKARASGRGRGKSKDAAKRGKPVRNVVQIRDFSRDLYEVVSEMFPSGFSQTRVMNGFVAMHTGRLDCIESDTELVAAVREIMNGDAGMVGVMDEVLALREDMEAVRKSLTKTRRYALMGALGSGATLDAMAKTHGSEQGLSAEELAALSDDVTRTMDVLDSSARDFESEEFGRGRQIRGGRR